MTPRGGGLLSPPPGDEVTAEAPQASAFPVEILALLGDLDVFITFKVNSPCRNQGRGAIPRRREGVS